MLSLIIKLFSRLYMRGLNAHWIEPSSKREPQLLVFDTNYPFF